jgi:hypothetical protein
MDLALKEFDVIVRRFEAATGNPAVLVETGESYHALEARRATDVAPAQGGAKAGV